MVDLYISCTTNDPYFHKVAREFQKLGWGLVFGSNIFDMYEKYEIKKPSIFLSDIVILHGAATIMDIKNHKIKNVVSSNKLCIKVQQKQNLDFIVKKMYLSCFPNLIQSFDNLIIAKSN